MNAVTFRNGSLAIGVALFLWGGALQPCHAIFGIFSSKDRDRMPTRAEVAAHDKQASRLFTAGEEAQEAGRAKKALDAYEKITRKFYFSQYAPEANFRWAELLLETGEPIKAFETYQDLIERHRSSPRFQRAVEQQYNIAVQSLTAKHGSIFGVVPKRTSRDRVVLMFQSIIASAPASIYAANSQYYIARIYEGQNEHEKAIQAFQKVVDEYPRSPKAPQAQLKIAEIYEKTARRPDNPSNLRQSREAYEDFITNFPEHQKQADAFAQLNVIDEKEARKSLKIAKYYQNQGKLKAAAIYFKDVLRSDNAALKLEARQGIDAIGKVDQEALEMARIDESSTRVKPTERLKNQSNYLGPPAPDVAAGTPSRRSSVPLVPSAMEPVPLPVTEEPELPVADSDPDSLPIDTESLIPSPPPASSEDVLGPGSLLRARQAEVGEGLELGGESSSEGETATEEETVVEEETATDEETATEDETAEGEADGPQEQ